MAKIIRAFTVCLLLSVTLTACGLFRKKNGCHTCPTWKNNTEVLPQGAM